MFSAAHSRLMQCDGVEASVHVSHRCRVVRVCTGGQFNCVHAGTAFLGGATAPINTSACSCVCCAAEYYVESGKESPEGVKTGQV